MNKEIVVGVMIGLITALMIMALAVYFDLFEKIIRDTQVVKVAEKLVDDETLRMLLVEKIVNSNEFDKIVAPYKIKGVDSLMFSTLYCRWKDEKIDCSDATHSWGGNVNFDLSKSGMTKDNMMRVQFKNIYKGDPVCHFNIESKPLLAKINPNEDIVKIYLYTGDGKPYSWSSSSHIYFMLTCFGQYKD